MFNDSLPFFLIFILSFANSPINYSLTSFSDFSSESYYISDCDSFENPNYILPKPVVWDGSLWNVSDDSEDRAYDVTVDFEGNLLLTGYSFSINNHSFLPILKYNAAGDLLWNTSIPSPGGIERGDGIRTDSTGSVYVAGFASSYSDDAWLWKFSSEGEHLWNSTFGGWRDQDAEDLCLDSQGNIIVVGETDEFFPAFAQQGFICKFNPTGQQLWNQTFGGQGFDEGLAVTIDGSDNYYLTGQGTHNDLWITLVYKFSSAGELLWNQTITVQDECWGSGIILSESEDFLFVAGGAYADSDNIWYSYLCKLKANNGKLKWQRVQPVLGFAEAHDLVLDSAGDVLVVGDTQGFTSGNKVDFFLCKHSRKDGSLLWTYTWNGTELDRCFGVAYKYSELGGEHICLVGETKSFGTTWTDILLLIIDDSDFDGLSDEWELAQGLNPFSADSDQDGLDDYQEVAVYGSDPLDSDSDDDGWIDGVEVAWRTNPMDSQSTPFKRKIYLFTTTIPIIGATLSVFIFLSVKRKHNQRRAQ